MNLVFIGASRFGLRCLEAAVQLQDCRVVGAVTAPSTFAISYRPEGVTNVLHADVAKFCGAHGIPCAELGSGMNDPTLFDRVRAWSPDAFLVVGWYHMIPRAWRSLAPAYGMHASLLPDYAGGAPLVWAMINGEKVTGISLFQMADGADDGPLVGQLSTTINPDDTIATLYARIEKLGLELLRTHLPLIATGTARLAPQDFARRRVMPQRSPDDGRIDWSQPAGRVHDFIRAQTRPYPGAFAQIGAQRITLLRSRMAPAAAMALAPGELALVSGKLLAGCGEGSVIEISSLVEGGVEWNAAEWFERYRAQNAGFRGFG